MQAKQYQFEEDPHDGHHQQLKLGVTAVICRHRRWHSIVITVTRDNATIMYAADLMDCLAGHASFILK